MRAFALRPAALGRMAATLVVSGMACTGVIGGAASSGAGGTAGNTGIGLTTGTGATSGTGTGGSATGTGSTTGTGGGGTGTGATAGNGFAAACAASNGVLNAGLTPARRLTRDQFNNTVRDLIGATGTPADALGPDEKIGPFNSNAIAPSTTRWCSSTQRSRRRWRSRPRRDGAALAVRPDDRHRHSTTCATRFVTEFGQHAYRRPLTRREITTYVSLYTLGKRGAGARERVPPGRRGDAAVAVLPLSPRRRSRPARRRRARWRSRPTSSRRACRTSSGTRCRTTRCSRAPRTAR